MSQTKFRQLLESNSLFDSHCHLNANAYDTDRQEIIGHAVDKGVCPIVDIAVDINSTRLAIDTAKQNPDLVYATAGIDPESFVPGSDLYVEDGSDVYRQFDGLIPLIENNLDYIVMIGETGLDNYWIQKLGLDEVSVDKSIQYQKELFEKHIKLAITYNLPLSIHSREAIDECIKLLQIYATENVWGVFHSITPEVDDDEYSFEGKLREILEMGFYISLNGIITYKSANLLRNTVLKIFKSKVNCQQSKVSLNDFYNAGFVFETDGPYLAPEGKRGERNEPANVSLVYDFLVSLL